MPTNEIECSACGEKIETLAMDQQNNIDCPKCGKSSTYNSSSSMAKPDEGSCDVNGGGGG